MAKRIVSEVSEGNFKTKLSAVVRKGESLRSNIQALLVFGFNHYIGEGEGDTGYLSRTLNACVGVKAIPTRTMQKYIEAHANVKFSKAKDGTNVFKKAKGEVPAYFVPTVAWWEFDKGHQAVADYDIVKRLVGMQKSISKAIEEGHVADGQDTAILYAMDKLTDVVTGVNLAIVLEAEELAAANEVVEAVEMEQEEVIEIKEVA